MSRQTEPKGHRVARTPARKRRAANRFAPYAVMLVAILAVLGLLFWFVRSIMASKPQMQTRQVPLVVHLIRPPPPPPEPPPPPPPPQKIQVPIPHDTPQPKPVTQAAQSAHLGLDTTGSAGSDNFGLVADPGGRDLVGTGTGQFVWYTSLVKDLVQDTLSNLDRGRQSHYIAIVRVWVSADGQVRRVTLAQSTGDHALDDAIQAALNHAGKVRESPPIEMPQPITLRIVSHS